MFWTDNIPSGLHTGDGSCFSNSPQYGDQVTPLPGRLARPGKFQGRMSPGKGQTFGSMQGTGNCSQLREVQSRPFPVSNVLRDQDLFPDFEGFPQRESDRKVYGSRRRIRLLQQSASLLLEKNPGPSCLSDSASSRGQTQDKIPPTCSAGKLGLQRRVLFSASGPSFTAGSELVDGDRTSGDGLFPAGGSPGPDVLVRRLGSGMGGSLAGQGRFRPLVNRRTVSFHQSQGVEGLSVRPSTFSRVYPRQHGRCLLRQRFGRGLLEEAGRYHFSSAQCRGSVSSEVDRVSEDFDCAPVHSRASQRPSGRSLQKEADSEFRMDSSSGGGRQAGEDLARYSGSVRHLTKLQTSGLLCSSPGSHERGNRRTLAVLGSHSGVCLPSILSSPPSPEQIKEVVQLSSHPDRSVLASEGVVPGPAGVPSGTTPSVTRAERSSQTTSFPPISSSTPNASTSCLETMQRFTRHEGFSSRVARQVSLARRKSTNVIYQHKWSMYRRWCREQGCSISRPSLSKIADFLLFLHHGKGLSVSAIRGYRSMLAAVFHLKLPSISTSSVIRDLLRSFSIQRLRRPLVPPGWDLNVVLQFLRSPPFEPLLEADFRSLSKKCLFLLALATAKRVGEIQGLSSRVASVGDDLSITYSLGFVAKTESANNPLPRSFCLKSLKDFVGDMPEELLLCPVRALKVYLERTKDVSPRPHSLFVSTRSKHRPMSKNGISFFLREVISDSGALRPDGGRDLRAHSIRGVSTSTAFARNWSIQQVLEAATWRSNSVFASFYLRDVTFKLEDWRSLGPFVAAGQVVNPSAPS